jgi:NAD(P)-dependent dehydrogenase (short-subunit alcohol dehydrogenase family)
VAGGQAATRSFAAMSDVLTDRVAVITGGASGIGKATVLRFLTEGAKVVVGDYNAENGQALVGEVGDPGRLRFIRTDVAEEAEVEALIHAAVESFGGLDVLFNNAGVGGAFGPLTEIGVDDWDRTFAVLVRSVFAGTKHAARVMIEQGRGGSIINTASVAGLGGGGGPLAYSSAKAAVINLTYCSAVELSGHRIRVNAICPGLIHTPLALGRHADRVRERMHEMQPWPDEGRPEHIAGLALYLAGPDSAFVTGEAIRADGGLLAAGPRMIDLTDPYNTAQRYAGYTDGTTGRAPEKRRLTVKA